MASIFSGTGLRKESNMKINITSIEKLTKALDKAQDRAKARTITAQDIVDTLNGISVPKSRLNGTKVFWDGAEHFPNAYKYIPMSTHWTADNINGKWYVTDIFRATCPNRKTSQGEITFSDSAKEWILEQASKL